MLSLWQIPALLHATGIKCCEYSLVPQTLTLEAGGGSWLPTTVLTILPDRAVHMPWPLKIFLLGLQSLAGGTIWQTHPLRSMGVSQQPWAKCLACSWSMVPQCSIFCSAIKKKKAKNSPKSKGSRVSWTPANLCYKALWKVISVKEPLNRLSFLLWFCYLECKVANGVIKLCSTCRVYINI